MCIEGSVNINSWLFFINSENIFTKGDGFGRVVFLSDLKF